MKLWQVIQWGNNEDGPDGWDTQCIVSAVDMQAAIKKAAIHFPSWEIYTKGEWEHTSADVVYLLGQDDKPDADAVLIVPVWIKPAYNLSHNRAWSYDYQSGSSTIKEWKEQNFEEDK